MSITYVVQVADKPGVLNRVASLVRRRGYNIESLTVGHTGTPGLSRITLVVDAEEDLPAVDVDPIRIGEVLSNLVSNAMRHTPMNGTITLTASSSGLTTATATLTSQAAADVPPAPADRP